LVASNHGHSASHGLEHDEPKRFGDRTVQEYVTGCISSSEGLACQEAGESDVILHGLEIPSNLFFDRRISITTDDKQAKGHGTLLQRFGHPGQEIETFFRCDSTDTD
jgi:hypothetical protein